MTQNFPPALVAALGFIALVLGLGFLVLTGWLELAALLLGIVGGLWLVAGIRLAYVDRDAPEVVVDAKG